jgi:hypothetical protein
MLDRGFMRQTGKYIQVLEDKSMDQESIFEEGTWRGRRVHAAHEGTCEVLEDKWMDGRKIQ